jgi:hypothetical protein
MAAIKSGACNACLALCVTAEGMGEVVRCMRQKRIRQNDNRPREEETDKPRMGIQMNPDFKSAIGRNLILLSNPFG